MKQKHTMTLKAGVVCLFALIFSACNADSSEQNQAKSERYIPPISSTWHWQLQGDINPNLPVDIYDIDLFDTPASLIQTLHSNGKKVICYFSAGSYENWRDDAGAFKEGVLGSPLDKWEGERWLDIRAESIKPIMLERLDLAQEKNCDGVEPDNVDGYTNNSGFKLTSEDQLSYNKWLAEQAHARGLSIGLKNDLDQIEALVEYFDFAVNEQCFEYNECGRLAAFTAANKSVFSAEYKSEYFDNEDARKALCGQAQKLNFSTLVLLDELAGGKQFSCF
ncbi:endo alpha-1,4 polygalactosaminidase [Leucothrix sargassi]|nr:endo alpha-1,4 polygalactosaminidase [Leucothrix sargassi]